MARKGFNSGGSAGTDDLPKAKINKATLKKAYRIFSYLKPYQFQFGIGLLLLGLGSLLSLSFPFFMGKLIDAATGNASGWMANLNWVMAALLVVLFVQALFGFFRIYLFVQVGERSLASIRVDAYKQMLSLPMDFFAKTRVGELHSRLSADLAQIQDTLTTTVAEVIRQILVLIGGISLLALTSGKLTLFMLAILPVIIITAVVFGRYIRKIAKAAQDKLAETNTIVDETLQAISSVKAFTNEGFEINRYQKAMQQVVNLALKGATLRGGFASFIIFCLFGCIVLVVWYGAALVGEGLMTVGDLTSFVIYAAFVGAAMGSFAEFFAQIQKALGATERVFEILDMEAEAVVTQPGVFPIVFPFNGDLVFDNVAFAYPSRPETTVLNNLNFTIKKGTQLAVVGPSGAGKSTIVGLLLRFYNPQNGIITIGGKDIQQWSLHDFRSQIGVVMQDVALFGGTIYDNIAYGKPNASENEVIDAAKKAFAHDFISAFPEQYHTTIGERGVKLSGGQRQRIAIARAILKNPALLILDEATSSLDSESEKLVQLALDALMKGRTSLVIAHRLSTIRKANQIVVINQGTVAELGNHEELMQLTNGIYRNLKNLQTETTND